MWKVSGNYFGDIVETCIRQVEYYFQIYLPKMIEKFSTLINMFFYKLHRVLKINKPF